MRYLSTVHRINSALERVSGFSPKIIDCCVNSCHAFYGSWAKDASCRVCGERRYITEGLVSKARRTFRYLPLIPRLHLLVHSESLSHKMSYRSKNAPSWSSGEHREVLRDYFDGKLYLDLDRKVNLLPRDILFCFSTDGFALFEKFRHDSWPLLLINLNMSPVDRAKIENMIPLGIIPGPKAPVCIESFLEPMMEEFQVLSRGVLFRNAENRASAFVRSFIFMVTGDLPAIAKICRLTGHNSRVPCRYCKIEGMYLPYKRHIYYPSFVRLTDSDRNEDEISTKQLYDPACLPERRSSETAEKLRELKMPSNSSGSNEIRKLGISGVSAFFNLASLDMFRSFPIDTMHLNYENVAKSMWKLWSSNWTSSYFNSSDNFVLSNASLYSIGAELQAASKTVPEGFGRPPRDITKDWGAFKAEDWIHWTLHYSVISLEGRLPEPYFSNWCIFVKLCVLCHQKVLQRSSIQLIEDSALEFFRQYESIYARHDMNRIFLMRYTVHLLLHLFESAQDCGPLPGCSQFPMERFIGTLCPMIKSNSKPVENLTKHLVLLERLKIAKWKGVYDSTQDEVIKQRRYIATNRRLQMDSEDKPRPELGYYAFLSPTRKGILTLKEIKLLKNYYMKAELFDANHPEGAFYSENRVNEVTFWDRLELLDYGEKLDEAFIVSSRYCSSSRREGSRSRNFVAADFLEGKSSFPKRYYGSVEKLFSHEWRGIQSMLAIISWGEQVISSGKGAIFLKGEVKIAFSKETTIESVEVIRRGIGVFERTEGSARRSKTFIIDPDALLESHNVEWVDCIPSKVI